MRNLHVTARNLMCCGTLLAALAFTVHANAQTCVQLSQDGYCKSHGKCTTESGATGYCNDDLVPKKGCYCKEGSKSHPHVNIDVDVGVGIGGDHHYHDHDRHHHHWHGDHEQDRGDKDNHHEDGGDHGKDNKHEDGGDHGKDHGNDHGDHGDKGDHDKDKGNQGDHPQQQD